MGTRADFYIGRGVDAEWLGSVAWDGHPDNFWKIRNTKTENSYRSAVAEELHERDDATLPADGWPWPWDDSGTSDYGYAFDGGKVYFSGRTRSGDEVWVLSETEGVDVDGYPLESFGKCVWPNMSKRKNVKAPGTKGSGALLLGIARK